VRLRVEGELARERESKRVLQQNLDKERARIASLQAQLSAQGSGAAPDTLE